MSKSFFGTYCLINLNYSPQYSGAGILAAVPCAADFLFILLRPPISSVLCACHSVSRITEEKLINRLDSRTLRPVNVLGLLVLSNNIKNGIGNIRDIKRRIMAWP